jgi:ribosome maturation factor RimP
MQRDSTAERIDKIAIKAATDNGVEFVQSEIVGSKRNMTVRIYIDKPAGVTLEDCSTVSRAIEEVIDADDFIPTPYVLEVSSPGLERPLLSVKDFEKFAGKKAKVKTSEAIDGQTNFNGRIASVEDSDILFEDKTNGAVRIPFDTIAKANLKVDLAEEFKKKR